METTKHGTRLYPVEYDPMAMARNLKGMLAMLNSGIESGFQASHPCGERGRRDVLHIEPSEGAADEGETL